MRPTESAEACELQHDPGIAVAPGDSFSIEKFEQWNSVLAGNAGPVLEIRDGKASAFLFDQQFPQRSDRRSMKNEFIAHAHQPFVPQQQLKYVAGAIRLDTRLSEHFVHRGHRQPGSLKRLL